MIIKPEISVIFSSTSNTPCAAKITSSIESILFQNFLDFELILLDDGLCAEISAIYCLFAETDGRIIYRQSTNPSMTAAQRINWGASLSSGKYLCFMTQDAEWNANALSQLHLSISTEYPHCGMIFASLENNQIIKDSSGYDCFLLKIPYKNLVEKEAVILKRLAFEAVQGFNENQLFADAYDWDLWRRLSRFFPIMHIPSTIGSINLTIKPNKLPRLDREKAPFLHKGATPSMLRPLLVDLLQHPILSKNNKISFWILHAYHTMEKWSLWRGRLRSYVKHRSHNFFPRLFSFIKRRTLKLHRKIFNKKLQALK